VVVAVTRTSLARKRKTPDEEAIEEPNCSFLTRRIHKKARRDLRLP